VPDHRWEAAGGWLVADLDVTLLGAAASFGELFQGESGQQLAGFGLTVARWLWPRPLVRRLSALEVALLIEADK
jgi:hypothetical protein